MVPRCMWGCGGGQRYQNGQTWIFQYLSSLGECSQPISTANEALRVPIVVSSTLARKVLEAFLRLDPAWTRVYAFFTCWYPGNHCVGFIYQYVAAMWPSQWGCMCHNLVQACLSAQSMSCATIKHHNMVPWCIWGCGGDQRYQNKLTKCGFFSFGVFERVL